LSTPCREALDGLHCPFGEIGERSGGRESTFTAFLLDQGPIGRAHETCENPPVFGQEKQKTTEKLRYGKINPDPYAKRNAGRVAATPALQSDPVGTASRTPQAHACHLLEYPHLAVARSHSAKAARRFRRARCGNPPAPHFLTSRTFWNCSTL